MTPENTLRYWQPGDPPMQEAPCRPDQAELLLPYDHHQVVVGGCWGILLTYHWPPLEEAAEPLQARVSLNPAPAHLAAADQVRAVVRKHPVVPAPIQAVLDQLEFRAAGF